MSSDDAPRAGVVRRWRRRTIWLLGAAVLAISLYWLAGLGTERYVRKQLDAAAASVCAVVDPGDPPMIAVDLFDRSVSVTGLVLLPVAGCSDVALRVQGRIDTVHVSGLSLMGVLFRDRARMDELQLSVAQAWITMLPDSMQAISNAQVKNEQKHWSIAIGSFDVALRSVTAVTQAGDTIRLQGNGFQAEGNDLRFTIGHEDALASLGCGNLQLSSDSLVGSMANGYNWSIGRCVLDQQRGTLELLRASIGPALGLEAFSATLPYETDVIEARVDTLSIAGLNMAAAFAQRTCAVRSVRMASSTVTVLRDKVAVDGDDPEKPLIGRLVRSLPVGTGADTIIVHGLDVTYHERVDRQRGYAVIPITGINATITGAKHGTIDTSALVLRARAIAFGTASVLLFLRTVVSDTTDRFDIEAAVGPMPFAAINAATGPLLDIRATQGRIDSLIYRMTADDRRASGMVRMNHRGLKLASGGRKSGETGNQIESALLNALVRKTSRNKIGNARDGRFAFERRRDRAIFNYLWSGLREGVKAELLPEALIK